MKKIVVMLLAVGALATSCNKQKHVPVSYSVETETGVAPQDVYVPSNGHKYVELYVKFLTGSSTDSVTLEVKGLPDGITVDPQRSSGIPTYYYKYTYQTNNMALGTYPVSIVATAPGTEAKTYNYNLVVIPNDCAQLFVGTLHGTHACSARDYTYLASADSTGIKNQLVINNFGGYGPETNTFVSINCNQDSLYVPTQNIGNGITLTGAGTFIAGKMTITYTTTGSTAETCTIELTK